MRSKFDIEDISTSDVKIYFASTNNDSLFRLSIDETVSSEMSKLIIDFVKQNIEREVVPYGSVDEGSNSLVLELALSEIDELKILIDKLNNDKYKMYLPKSNVDDLEDINYYIFSTIIDDKKICLIKKYSVAKLIHPKQIIVVATGKVYKVFDNKKVITFETDFDAFIMDESIYIIKDTSFSYLTGYISKEISRATEVINKIDTKNLIVDTSKLRADCATRPSYLRKLSKISDTTINKLNIDKIRKVKKNRNIDIKITKDGKLDYDSPKELKNLLDFILDNFVKSEVTDENYRALNKKKD